MNHPTPYPRGMITALATLALTLAATLPLEDEPGWDCATMGNRICGSTVTVTPDGIEPGTGEYIGDGQVSA